MSPASSKVGFYPRGTLMGLYISWQGYRIEGLTQPRLDDITNVQRTWEHSMEMARRGLL